MIRPRPPLMRESDAASEDQANAPRATCPVCGGTGEVELIDEEVGCHIPVPCEACRRATTIGGESA